MSLLVELHKWATCGPTGEEGIGCDWGPGGGLLTVYKVLTSNQNPTVDMGQMGGEHHSPKHSYLD